MKRDELLNFLANRIHQIQTNGPTLVGIDGIDGAGKTTMANELVPYIEKLGRTVARTSIDGFHNPREIRIAQGNLSPKGYFEDSFDYDWLNGNFLEPIKKLSAPTELKSAKFDFRTNSTVENKAIHVDIDTIVLFEGVFLYRPELNSHWDFRIFVDIDFDTSLARGIKRDAEILGGEDATREKYLKRYIPGQKLYFEKCQPKEKADIVIKNVDPANPLIPRQ